MIYLLYALHIIVCLFLILVVLLQQGKGADLSVFGGGSTQTAFGARGAATLLHKLTVGSFVVFILTTMGIAMMLGTGGTASVIDDEAETAAPAVPAPPAEVPEETARPAAPAVEEPAAPAPEDTAPGTPPTGDDGP